MAGAGLLATEHVAGGVMIFSVVIPSKTASNLEPCIRSIRAAGEACQIIIVDDFDQQVGGGHPLSDCNGYLAKAGALWCGGEKPFIFARNVNLGIRAAGQDDVLILNDDALLQTPGGFSLLQRTAQEHPEFGIIAATCNNVGNQNQWPKGIGLREEPRMACFVAVLIPRRTIDAVGFLDERYVGYGLDDDDYSLRIRKAGLKIGVHDGCYVDHGSLTSTFRGSAGAGGDFLPNMRLFIEKWGVDNWNQSRETSQFRDLFSS